MSLRRAGLLVGALLGLAAPAGAQDAGVLTGTLKTISDRGTILIGVRGSAVPFAFKNRAGQPVGFSVDICHGIAADVATALHRDLLDPDAPAWQTGVRVVYVPVTADARMAMVMDGSIDLECGSTTATAERARSVAFSPVFFLAGTKLLAATGSPLASYRDAKRIAVSTGTTNAAVLTRLATQAQPPIAIVEAPDTGAAYDLLAAGAADAMASDDVLLAGLVATKPGAHRFRIVGDYLSFEPYAIALRRDDPDFASTVKQSFARMASDGVLAARYRRWFNDPLPEGDTLDLPISAALTEMYRAMGQGD